MFLCRAPGSARVPLGRPHTCHHTNTIILLGMFSSFNVISELLQKICISASQPDGTWSPGDIWECLILVVTTGKTALPIIS